MDIVSWIQPSIRYGLELHLSAYGRGTSSVWLSTRRFICMAINSEVHLYGYQLGDSSLCLSPWSLIWCDEKGCSHDKQDRRASHHKQERDASPLGASPHPVSWCFTASCLLNLHHCYKFCKVGLTNWHRNNKWALEPFSYLRTHTDGYN